MSAGACTYEIASWRCRAGNLAPSFGEAPIRQPCPACRTLEFLRTARRRAGFWDRTGACVFCAQPGRNSGAEALSAAIREALAANPRAARSALRRLGIGEDRAAPRGLGDGSAFRCE